jgi:hypothetical protein
MFSPDGPIRRKIKVYAPNFWLGTLGIPDLRRGQASRALDLSTGHWSAVT